MKYMDYDLRNLPLVVMTVNPIEPTLEQYKTDMLAMNDELLNNHSNMIWICNFKHVKLVPSEHRILAGNWTKNNSQKLKERVVCVVMIECSIWTSIVLKGMLLIAPSPVPTHVVKDIHEARKLLSEKYSFQLPGIQ